jgi:hypothetical protein
MRRRIRVSETKLDGPVLWDADGIQGHISNTLATH